MQRAGVGTATGLLADVADAGDLKNLVADIQVRPQRQGRAGREAHHADPVRCQAPLGRVLARHSDRLAPVFVA